MSDILNNWRKGIGFPDVLVIDGHVHLAEWPSHETFETFEEVPEKAVEYMNANGVDAICAVSGGYMWEGSDYTIGNEKLLRWWQAVPDRIIPFFHINPNDSPDGIDRELNHMYDSGMRCIKLLNSYQEKYPGDGPNLIKVYEFAADRNMIVFNHHWSYEELDVLAERFSNIPFVGAHGAPLPLLKKHNNVYTNIWNYGTMGWLDRNIAEVGAHKFMFGSDAFMNPMTAGIGPVVYSPVTDDERRQMLGLTVARLIDSVGVLPDYLKSKM